MSGGRDQPERRWWRWPGWGGLGVTAGALAVMVGYASGVIPVPSPHRETPPASAPATPVRVLKLCPPGYGDDPVIGGVCISPPVPSPTTNAPTSTSRAAPTRASTTRAPRTTTTSPTTSR